MTVNTTLWRGIKYEPHPKQREFHESRARFKVAVCGRRFGKSRMAAAEVEPKIMQPNTRGWIVGPEYKVGEKEFRYIWDDLIVTMKLGNQMKRKAYNVRTGEMYIETPWGSRVDVMSASHPDMLVGEGLDWVIISEAAKQNPEVWEKYIRPALADRHGTAIFPSTPEGFNWFYDRYRDGQNQNMKEWESWRYPSWENPYVYPGGFDDPEIQSQLRSPEDAWFWQELGADFRSVVGLVYPEWDDRMHVKKLAWVESAPYYGAADPGYTNPFAFLDIQEVDGNVHVLREYYQKGLSNYQNATELKVRGPIADRRWEWISSDSASPDAKAEMGSQLAPVIAKDEAKDVGRGWQEVKRFLRGDDGTPHLFVDPSCVNLINEMESYRVKGAPKHNPGLNVREEAEKKDDHALDALRYFIMHRFVLGADSHLDKALVSPTVGGEDSARGLFTWGDEGIRLGSGGLGVSGW